MSAKINCLGYEKVIQNWSAVPKIYLTTQIQECILAAPPHAPAVERQENGGGFFENICNHPVSQAAIQATADQF